VFLLVVGFGATEGTRTYELPAGDAATALRQLSEISGREVLFAAEIVRGVRTNAVRGQLTALDAAKQMVAGTKLAVTQDEKTGAIAVHRQRGSNSPPPRRTD
jgi:iron complex outermembrane receptor protein